MLGMNTTPKLLLAAGAIIAAALFFVNIYLAGILTVFEIVLVMSFLIMRDTTCLPEITAHLRDDAKAIILANKGNSPAMNIHVILVPLDIAFDLAALAADASYEYLLPSMIGEVKVTIAYENEKKNAFSHTAKLSAMAGEYDPFTPLIPLFKTK